MAVADQIRAKLTGALQPSRLEITDDSHLHAGHAGARPDGESHFRVKVVSKAFEGKPLVAPEINDPIMGAMVLEFQAEPGDTVEIGDPVLKVMDGEEIREITASRDAIWATTPRS